ncbi:MAG: DUF1919 domain-containing protein [Kiritimatiellia bacterium]|jgi:uncharacterized protein (DUF1919 family)
MRRLATILRNRFNLLCYAFRRQRMIRRYAGDPVSILSNNCLGGLICHDVGIKFDTPTVNLWMTCDDFIGFMENLPEMLKEEVVEIPQEASLFPVGQLAGRITLNFTHYRSFVDAKDAWNRRRIRVDFNRIVVVMADNSDLSDEAIRRFKQLPYPKKMFVQSRRKFEILGDCGLLAEGDFSKGFNITDFSGWNGRRFYHQFDFVGWLNSIEETV